MAESVTEPGTDSTEEPGRTILENSAADGTGQTTQSTATSTPMVIWTPRFITIFFLTLVAGLSAESLLTEGWLNSWYAGVLILEAHIVLVLGCLIAILIFSRSWWVRLGSIFGFIWAIFLAVELLINLQQIDSNSLILAYVNAAMSMALLGSFLCFSIYRMPFRTWDGWFFRLAAVFGACMVAFIYFFPSNDHSLRTLVYAVSTTALFLCVLTWSARPSCWKTQPGLTFLFGAMPAILLLLSIYNRAMTNYFLYEIVGYTSRGSHAEPNFFFTQVALFSLFLGTMRLLQCEIRN
jgi:hypothetical protein